MKALRSALSVLISAAILVAVPGPECWAAAARGLGAGPRARVQPVRLLRHGAHLSAAAAPSNNRIQGASPVRGAVLLPASAARQAAGARAGLEAAVGEMGGAGRSAASRSDAQRAGGDRLFDNAASVPGASGSVSALSAKSGGSGGSRYLAKGKGRKGSRRRMPKAEDPDNPESEGHNPRGDTWERPVDDIGNPVGERGDPDTTGGEGRGAVLFGAAALGSAFAGDVLARAGEAVYLLPMVVASLIVHEMSHARAAYKLGDPTAALSGRMSLSVRSLMTHVNGWTTVVLPTFAYIVSGSILGAANPVPLKPWKFQKAGRQTAVAKTALAGPAANFALAAGAAMAQAGLVAAGIEGPSSALKTVATINVALGLFNLLPWYPLDGHQIALSLLSFVSRDAAAAIKSWEKRGQSPSSLAGTLPWVPLAVFTGVAVASGQFSAAVTEATSRLLGAAGALVSAAASLLGLG